MAFRVGQLVMFNKLYMKHFKYKGVLKRTTVLGKQYCFVRRRNRVGRIVRLIERRDNPRKKPEVIAELDISSSNIEGMNMLVNTSWLRPLR